MTTKAVTRKDSSESTKTDVTTILIDLARTSVNEFFQTPDGTVYGAFMKKGQLTYCPLQSAEFSRYLCYLYRERYHREVPRQADEAAVNALIGRAEYGDWELPVKPVHTRIGPYGGRLYIDLCNKDDHKAVEISPAIPSGWRVVDNPPIVFLRSPNMLPLPEPAEGGDGLELVDVFGPYLEYDDFILLTTWLTYAIMRWEKPSPQPVLSLMGKAAEGKSTLARWLESLIDPRKADSKELPLTSKETFIIASSQNVWVIDNSSRLSKAEQNVICKLSTGGGVVTIKKYTDDTQLEYKALLPVIVTSIEDVITAPDLRSRTLFMNVARQHSKGGADAGAMQELMDRFELLKPRILGVLYRAIAEGMEHFDQVRSNKNASLRLADFEIWGQCVEEPLGFAEGDFLMALADNAERNRERIRTGGNLLIRVMLQFVNEHDGYWEGTTRELLGLLTGRVPQDKVESQQWLRNEKALSCSIAQIISALRDLGIEYEEAGSSPTGAQKYRLYQPERFSEENMLA